MYTLKTDAGHVVGTCREVKRYQADAWRPAQPTESPGAKVHRLVMEKKAALQISYADALAKVLAAPENAALKREFAKHP